MQLTKNGITVEVIHPADIRRYKGLGYVEVKTPEELNAEAIETVNASKGTPKTPAKKDGDA